MAAKDTAGVAVGLALAGFGLGAYLASGPSAPAPAMETQAPPAAETVSVVETVVVPAPQMDIPGISAATERLLAGSGYAGATTGGDLGLPPAVARVLEREGAVLLVPEGDGS